MLTITLPPELEQIISEQARRQGTTPELLTLDKLRAAFASNAAPVAAEEGQTMADFLGDFIGCYDSRDIVPGGANIAENTGRKFKKLLTER